MEYNAVNSKCHIQDKSEFSFILFPIYLKAINFVFCYTSVTFLLILFCFLCFSCTKSLHKRRSVEHCWMQLYAGWPSKIPYRYQNNQILKFILILIFKRKYYAQKTFFI